MKFENDIRYLPFPCLPEEWLFKTRCCRKLLFQCMVSPAHVRNHFIRPDLSEIVKVIQDLIRGLVRINYTRL